MPDKQRKMLVHLTVYDIQRGSGDGLTDVRGEVVQGDIGQRRAMLDDAQGTNHRAG